MKIVKIAAVVLIVVGLGLTAYFGFFNKSPAGASGEVIFFYGSSCPHCHHVLSFLDENGVDGKVKFEKKEVYGNQENAELMREKAKICGLETDNIGVPFLFADGKCMIGSPQVIEFFKSKI